MRFANFAAGALLLAANLGASTLINDTAGCSALSAQPGFAIQVSNNSISTGGQQLASFNWASLPGLPADGCGKIAFSNFNFDGNASLVSPGLLSQAIAAGATAEYFDLAGVLQLGANLSAGNAFFSYSGTGSYLTIAVGSFYGPVANSANLVNSQLSIALNNLQVVKIDPDGMVGDTQGRATSLLSGDVSNVPEPSSVALISLPLAALALAKLRRRHEHWGGSTSA